LLKPLAAWHFPMGAKKIHAKGKVLVTRSVTQIRHAERDEYFPYPVELFRRQAA
jgi:hypothetical protein